MIESMKPARRLVACALASIATFASARSSRAQEPRRFSGELTASSGYAWFTTLGSAATLGFGGAMRWNAIKLGLSYEGAAGVRGDAQIVTGKLGAAIPLPPFELDLLGLIGLHAYSDVGGLHTD